jgi:FimV-like protein
MRKLTIILTLILTLFALEVDALGLGHIRVSSKLNEPFNAKIDISSIPKTSLSSIQVRLASETDFKQAGLDRLYVLTKLRFTIQVVSKNKAVVHIITEQAIKEPFLNFLVEVKWIGGRMLREYTVLLDPPLYKETASTSFQPVRQSPRKTVRVSRRNDKPVVSGDPYTISRHDSLWKIAKRTRPSGVSIREHMRRIYNANPHAFIGGKKTLIKAGKVINIPGWTNQGRSPRRTRRAPDNFIIPSVAPPSVGPRLVLRPPEATPAPPVKPAIMPNKAGESNRAEIEDLQKQIRKFRDSYTKIIRKNDELKQDVLKNRDLAVTMKKQLDELNKMLKLQNKRMADLQSQLTNQKRDNQQLKNKIAELSASATSKTQPALMPLQPKPVPVVEENPPVQPERVIPTVPQNVPDIPLILPEVASNLAIQVQKQVSQQLQASPSLKEKIAAFPILLAQTPNAKVAPLHLSPEQLADLNRKLERQIGLQLVNKPELISRITEDFYGSPEKIAKLMTELVIVQFKKGTPEEIAKLVKSLKIDISKPSSLVDTASLVTDLKEGSLNEFVKMTAKSQVAQLQAKSPEQMTQFIDQSDEDSGLVRQAKVLLQQAMDNWIIVILALVGGILIIFLVRFKKNKLSILPKNLALPKSFKKEMKGLGENYQGKPKENETYKQVFLDEVRRITNEVDTESEFKPSQAAVTQNVASISEGDEELHEEVELYKAYERYDKAEELLREAIEQYPDYPEYRLKLLEIHAAVNDLDKFKQDAASLHNAVNGEGPLWKNALALWESLAPNQALLSSEVQKPSSTFIPPTTIVDIPEKPEESEFLETDDFQGIELPPIAIEESSEAFGSNQLDDLGNDFDFGDELNFDEGMDETGEVKIVETGKVSEANQEELSLDEDLSFDDYGTEKTEKTEKDETAELLKDQVKPLEESNDKYEEKLDLSSLERDDLSLETGDDSDFSLEEELSSETEKLLSLDESDLSFDGDNDKTNGLSFEDELSSLDTGDLSLETGDDSEFSLEEELSSETGKLSLDESDLSFDGDNDKTKGLSFEDELSSLDMDDLSLENGNQSGLSFEDELSSLDSADQKTSELSLEEELSAIEEDESGASDGTVFLVEKETIHHKELEEPALENNENDDLFSLTDDNNSTATEDLSLEDELSWLNEDSSLEKSNETDIAAENLSSVDDLLNDDLSLSNDTESKDLLEDDELDFSALNSNNQSQDSEMSSLSDDDDLNDLLSQLDTEEISESEGNPLNGQFDLAQMYIDMDENDTAREILEELLKSTNGEEVRLAQKMIAELG